MSSFFKSITNLFKTVNKLDVEYAGFDPSEMSGMQAFNLL